MTRVQLIQIAIVALGLLNLYLAHHARSLRRQRNYLKNIVDGVPRAAIRNIKKAK